MPLTREDEKKLIQRSKKGDAEAMSILYESFREELLRSASIILHNEDDAQDIVSATFILFFRSIDKFDTKYPIRPWLHKILRNETNTLFKNRSKHNEAEDSLKINLETFEPNQEETVFSSEEIKFMEKAMKNIKEEERWILESFYYQELSVKDISSLLIIPEGTVKSRLFTARASLANEIKKIMDNRNIEA